MQTNGQKYLPMKNAIILQRLSKKLIGSATDRGNNYADILLAMYNAINDAVYDYELETE